MGKLADFLALANAAFGRFTGSPLVARSYADDDALGAAKLGAHDGLAVEGVAGGTAIPVSGTVTATVDTSALATHAKQDVSKAVLDAILAKIIAAPATQATLADILAKIIAAPATEAKQDTAKAVFDNIYASLWAAADESDNLRGQLALDYIVPLVYPATFTTPCDSVTVAVDDYQIAYEGVDGAYTYLDAKVNDEDPALPVDDWTDNLDGTYTHGGAGAFTDALQWNSKLTVGSKVLVKYTTSDGSAGTIQASAGTTAGAASAHDAGAVTEVLTVDGNMTFSLTPSADYDGTVSSIAVYPFTMPLAKNERHPIRMSKIMGVITSANALVPTAVLHVGWYRKPV